MEGIAPDQLANLLAQSRETVRRAMEWIREDVPRLAQFLKDLQPSISTLALIPEGLKSTVGPSLPTLAPVSQVLEGFKGQLQRIAEDVAPVLRRVALEGLKDLQSSISTLALIHEELKGAREWPLPRLAQDLQEQLPRHFQWLDGLKGAVEWFHHNGPRKAQEMLRRLRDLLYRNVLGAVGQALQEARLRGALGGGRVRRVRLDPSTLIEPLLTRFSIGRRLNGGLNTRRFVWKFSQALLSYLLSLLLLPPPSQAIDGDQEPEGPRWTTAPLGPDPPRPLILLIVPKAIQPIAGPSAA